MGLTPGLIRIIYWDSRKRKREVCRSKWEAGNVNETGAQTHPVPPGPRPAQGRLPGGRVEQILLKYTGRLHDVEVIKAGMANTRNHPIGFSTD